MAGPTVFSPKRGELFCNGIDHIASDGVDRLTMAKNRKHIPSLDGLRSPFSENMVLPALASSRKARVRAAEADFDTSTKSRRQGTTCLGGSQSLPSLHEAVSPDHAVAPAIPRRQSARVFKKDRFDNSVTAECPSAPSPCSDATETPSTVQDSPAWQPTPCFATLPSERISLSRLMSQPSRHAVSKAYRKGGCFLLDRATPAESPLGAPADSDATATPSTALASPAFHSRAMSPRDAGVFIATPSSRAEATTPSSTSACSTQGRGLKWRQGEEIGSGSYGHVYMAQCKSTGHIFAVKVSRVRDTEEKASEQIQQELDICKNLRHRHIVACLGNEFVNGRLYIYLEYVPGGSLRHMVNEFGPLEAPLLVKATRAMLKGLNYLHKRNPPVVHRDLKGANVLIDLQFCVKLADFGCSKCDDMSRSFSKVGSIHWVAPEVLQDAGHGRKADIWSLGCVIIEIATAADPWGPKAFDNMVQAMYVIAASERTPPIPDVLSDGVRSLLRSCIQRAPEERPSAVQLLQHECLQRESNLPECCFSRPPSMSNDTRKRCVKDAE